MLSQLEKGDERLLAAWETASEGSIILVLQHVVAEAGLCSELFSTFFFRTNIRGFFSMNAFVVVQGIGSLERLVATVEGADIRTVVGVCSEMSRDFRFEFESLFAAGEFAIIGLGA